MNTHKAPVFNPMVTYEALFAFVALLIALAALFKNSK